jgi:pimeloyl-ACP methyl ester carboxylesterase
MRSRIAVTWTALALLSIVTWGAIAFAAADPAGRCASAKASAAGKKTAGLLKAFGKNTKSPNAAKLDAGVSKARSKFTKAFTKAEGRGGCHTTGDADAIEGQVDAFVSHIVTDIGGPLDYSDDTFWLCKPGMQDNQCLVNDIDATNVAADLSTSVEPFSGSDDHPFDCFYAYPTTDLAGSGNDLEFSDISLELDPLLSQAARFTSICRMFAPLYRQVKFSTPGPERAKFGAIAYRDVEAAWFEYLDNHNNGRNVVIIGHSQGTGHLTTLVQQHIDGVPAVEDKLIAALLIGGRVDVPEGQDVGGTFSSIPLCTSDAQTGCVIAYRSYAEGFEPVGGSNVVDAVNDTACTNPAALAGGVGFGDAYIALSVNQIIFNLGIDPGELGLTITTPFMRWENFYELECVKDDQNRSYLEVRFDEDAIGEDRENLIPFTHFSLNPAILGAHILDYTWAIGDLIDLVATKAAAMP